MAKDLPYFKFFCSEWTDGDVTLESYEIQGFFINVCSYYWSNGCKMELEKLEKKFRHSNDLINQIIECKLIKIKNNKVYISFLDEQLSERKELSNVNSRNAKKRWKAKKSQSESNANAYANASDSQCENNAIKKREEKKRKDKIDKDYFIDNERRWFNALCTSHKLDYDKLIDAFSIFWDKNYLGIDTPNELLSDRKKHFNNWLKVQIDAGNLNNASTSQREKTRGIIH